MSFEHQYDEPPRHVRKRRLLAMAVLVAIGCILFLPTLDRPWTTNEPNAATYYSPFSQNWERFGFFHMRGLEVSPVVQDLGEGAIGYMNHPPAMAWLLYACGIEEWKMRLPTVISAILLALILFAALAPRIGDATAFSAGLFTLVPPTVSVYGQISYELCVAVFGFTMLFAFDRVIRGARPLWPSHLAVVVCGFIGPWFDWSFWVYCAGAVVLAVGRCRGFWRTIGVLAVPGAAAAFGAASILVWREWVLTAEHLPRPPQVGLLEIVSRVWHESEGRSFAEWAAGFTRTVQGGFTWPLLVVALIGLVPALARLPRLTIAFGIGIAHPLMFPSHSFDHPMFFVYFVPCVAICAALAGDLAARVTRSGVARWIIVAIAAGWPGVTGFMQLQRATSNFYLDLGRTLTDAVGEDDTYNVGHGWPYGAYLAYVDSWRVVYFSVRDAAVLAAAPASGAPRGTRYLWLRFGDVPPGARAQFAEPPALEQLLEPLPRTRVPELEVRIDVTGKGNVVEITEAWLVTLSEPQ